MEKIKSECFWEKTIYYFKCPKCGKPNEHDEDMWHYGDKIKCDKCNAKFLMSNT